MFDFSYSLVRDETSHENKQFLIPSKYRSTPFKMCVYAKLNQILAVGPKSCILLKQNLSSSISYIFLKFVNVNQSQTDTILVFLFFPQPKCNPRNFENYWRNFVYSRSLIFRVELLGRVQEFVQLQLWSNGLWYPFKIWYPELPINGII